MDATAKAAAQYIALYGKNPSPAQLRRFMNGSR